MTTMEQLTRADRLREAARELWGDAWTLHTREYADGATDRMVYHSRGLTEVNGDPVIERDRLLFDDKDTIVHDRVRVRKQEQLESVVVDRTLSI